MRYPKEWDAVYPTGFDKLSLRGQGKRVGKEVTGSMFDYSIRDKKTWTNYLENFPFENQQDREDIMGLPVRYKVRFAQHFHEHGNMREALEFLKELLRTW